MLGKKTIKTVSMVLSLCIFKTVPIHAADMQELTERRSAPLHRVVSIDDEVTPIETPRTHPVRARAVRTQRWYNNTKVLHALEVAGIVTLVLLSTLTGSKHGYSKGYQQAVLDGKLVCQH